MLELLFQKRGIFECKKFMCEILHFLSLFVSKLWKSRGKKYRIRFFEGKDQNTKTKYVNLVKIE